MLKQRLPIRETRACRGCGKPIMAGRRERNKKLWCSDRCRVRTYSRNHPEYRARQAELAAARHKATHVPVSRELECAMCGEAFRARRADAKYCSKKCRYRATHRSRRGKLAAVKREQLNLAEIGNRDGWTCGICSKPIDRTLTYPHLMSASLDHIVPLALGGEHTGVNAQVAHLDCNRRKGSTAT